MTATNKQNGLFIIALLALIAGLTLSILSEIKICSEACAEGTNYRLLGLPFAPVGIAYFSALIVGLFLSRTHRNAFFVTSLLLASGIGAEAMFILIQKMSGSWCPLCLAIAASILIAALAFGLRYLREINEAIETKKSLPIRSSIKRALASVPAALIGLLIAFFGVTKVDKNVAETNALEDQLVFGDKDSNVEIYIFTSWTCPACRKLEPALERMIPNIFKLAKVTFVDFGEDMTTLNYLPYNLSFMIHNKSAYVDLRHLLKEIASTTGSPTEEEVEKQVKNLGLKYQQLNYSQIALAIEYYKDLVKKYKVKAIPAVVVDKKGAAAPVVITGLNITMENIKKASVP